MMNGAVVARAGRDPYIAPHTVATTTLGRLLEGAPRTIPSSQQARFGFVADPGQKADGLQIWCAGDVGLVNRPAVAIVGTRQVSPEGAARARRLARELAEAGVVVVSGLAEGVDTHALASAIGSGGKTIAVIGTPIDQAYPAANKRLQEQIYSSHLLVSQFAPGARVFRGNFPTRNKLMAAISDATVVIEASDSSGTLHQAAECMRLGRMLFIAKSVVEDPKLTWPASFVQQPLTHVLSSTSDILDRLGGGACRSK